jgi:glycogen debranching enzyme
MRRSRVIGATENGPSLIFAISFFLPPPRLDENIEAVLTNIKNTFIYERLADHGPHKGPITREKPMTDPYFTILKGAKEVKEYDFSKCPLDTVDGQYCLVNNGWLWGGDPSTNFISPASSSYLRHEIIIWGDCVKLAFGNCPEDNPWLWKYMAEYTRTVSKWSHGLRIDNCHSTPMHVGQYLLDEARNENPNCFILAELFTNSRATDILFTNTLGLNALVHEGMSRSDAKDFSTMLHIYGGPPIGTFSELPHTCLPARALLPRACVFDATHDTHFPAQDNHSYRHHMPMAALSSMINNSVGSTRGFDEFLHDNEFVVNNKHRYRTWHGGHDLDPTRHVNLENGMMKLRL